MRIIDTGGNDKLFIIDGLPYRKGLYEVFYNQESSPEPYTSIGIRNIHNQQPISSPIKVNEYEIDGVVYNDINSLVETLSIVLGFNTGGGGGTGDIPNLQQVTGQGNTTNNDIITTGSIFTNGLSLVNANNTAGFNTSSISVNHSLELPNKSGIIALLTDIEQSLENETLQSVTNRGGTTNSDVIFEGEVDMPNLEESDTPFDNILVWDDSTGKIKYSKNNYYSPISIFDYVENETYYEVKVLLQSRYIISNPNIVSDNIFSIGISSDTGVFSIAQNITKSFLNYTQSTVKGFPTGLLLYSINIPKSDNPNPLWGSFSENIIISSSYQNNLNIGNFGLGTTLLNKIRINSSQLIVTSDSNYTLLPTSKTVIFTANGSITNLQLPPILGNEKIIILLTNAGTGDLIINADPLDVDGIWEGGMNLSSTSMDSGSTARIVNDGLKYRINS